MDFNDTGASTWRFHCIIRQYRPFVNFLSPNVHIYCTYPKSKDWSQSFTTVLKILSILHQGIHLSLVAFYEQVMHMQLSYLRMPARRSGYAFARKRMDEIELITSQLIVRKHICKCKTPQCLTLFSNYPLVHYQFLKPVSIFLYEMDTGCIANISVCISKLVRQFLSAYKITNQSRSDKHIFSPRIPKLNSNIQSFSHSQL